MNLNDTSSKTNKNGTLNTEVLIWVKTGIILLVCIELLIAVFSNSFFSFLCFTTILFVIFPTINTLFKKYFIKQKENKNVFKIIIFFHWVGKKGHELLIRNFTFLQHNVKKYLIISLLFIIGHLMFGNSIYKTNIEKQKEILQQYLIKNKTDKSLKNLRLLAEIGELFDNSNYSLENPHDGYITHQRSSNKNTVFIFNPQIDFLRIHELKYLKPDEQRGELKNYFIKFIFNDDNEIISKKSYLNYSNIGLIEFINDSTPDISLLLDSEIVENARLNKEAEEQNERNLEALKQRQNEFEERCMSSWDDSHIELVKYIKKNINDPESFEHVETSYGLQKDYAIIVMQFRCRNAFGGLVLNSVKATVSLDDCSVLSIEE